MSLHLREVSMKPKAAIIALLLAPIEEVERLKAELVAERTDRKERLK